MGCCYSCDEEGDTQQGEANERTHLLVDPVSNNTAIQRVRSDDFIAGYPNSLPKRTDEQSALNRILQETATNVIDVAALDSHTLEQHEYQDRISLYMHRQNTLPAVLRWKPLPRQCLLADIPGPEKVLSAEPTVASDLSSINWALDRASQALAEVQVEHKEELVVPFRIP